MTRAAQGWWLGLLGVAIFALTLPMTRLAVGTEHAPQLPPLFVTAGRAVVAALCSALLLAWVDGRGRHAGLTALPRPGGGRRPAGHQWRDLAFSAAGTVVGFPFFMALAMREVPAVHAAVIVGVIPLGTAVAAALVLRQRPPAAFWGCAVAGCALVLGYAAWRGGGAWHRADGLLLLSVASASFGYVYGARVAGQIGAERTICWALLMAAPVSVPLAWASVPPAPGLVALQAWLGFGYVAVFSMWIGFFAWYRGLALGGTLRVSQVQLLQPFLTVLFAVPLLGEPLEPATLAFMAAVIAAVALGRRVAVPGEVPAAAGPAPAGRAQNALPTAPEPPP